MEIVTYSQYGERLNSALTLNGMIHAIVKELVTTKADCSQMFGVLGSRDSINAGVNADLYTLAMMIKQHAANNGIEAVATAKLQYIRSRLTVERQFWGLTSAEQREYHTALTRQEELKGLSKTQGSA